MELNGIIYEIWDLSWIQSNLDSSMTREHRIEFTAVPESQSLNDVFKVWRVHRTSLDTQPFAAITHETLLLTNTSNTAKLGAYKIIIDHQCQPHEYIILIIDNHQIFSRKHIYGTTKKTSGWAAAALTLIVASLRHAPRVGDGAVALSPFGSEKDEENRKIHSPKDLS